MKYYAEFKTKPYVIIDGAEPQTKKDKTMIKLFYNGIKVNNGKLQKCWYSKGALHSYPEDTITIYAREYCRFSKEIREVFAVKNDSDSMSDYFENDTIRVIPSHPMYKAVKNAFDAQENKNTARRAKRKAA